MRLPTLQSRGIAARRGPAGLRTLLDSVTERRVRAGGIVLTVVDEIAHGMRLGAAGMHGQVRQWARGGFLAALIEALHEAEFQVFLTSDHGNLETQGVGSVSEGAIAEMRGHRARIYPDERLRAQVHERCQAALAWEPAGLPERFYPLLAPPGGAFVPVGERIVGHGGLSVEEAIVPFIRIDRKSN